MRHIPDLSWFRGIIFATLAGLILLPSISITSSSPQSDRTISSYGRISAQITHFLKTCHRIEDRILSEDEIREVARNFDAWFCNEPRLNGIAHTYVSVFKDENPNMLCGFYKHAEALSDTWGGDLMDIEQPYWFLKDESGNIIRNKRWPSLRLLDIGHPEVQQAWANNCKKHFDEIDYDFVFADCFSVSFQHWRFDAKPVNPRTGYLYTEDEWYNDRIEFLRTFKEICSDKLLIANILWDLFWPNPDRLIYEECDGFLWEDEVLHSEKGIELVLPICQKWAERSKYWLYWGRLPSEYPTEQMSMYRLCFYLLHSNGNTTYCTIRGNEEYPNQYKGDLGAPLQNCHKLSNTSVYARRFEKAWILFNASPNSCTIILGDIEVVLEGHTGKMIPISTS